MHRGESLGRFPVFRATVTEAHCLAEWMGGRLPSRNQWLRAAGGPPFDKDRRPGPFSGDKKDLVDLVPLDPKGEPSFGLGPWPVDWGKRDVSIHGCRQMATNGKEWTRDTGTSASDPTIPLERKNATPEVYVMGGSYTSPSQPLTFVQLQDIASVPCKDARDDVSFRVVLEQ
jgi:formylglycine-generating enzyme required for sulfatase activity